MSEEPNTQPDVVHGKDSVNRIEDMIDRGVVQIDSYLSQEDFVREVRDYNPKVMGFLRKNSGCMKKLIDYVIKEPNQATDDNNRKFKFPFLSGQIFQSECEQVLNILVLNKTPEGSMTAEFQNLAYLFTYLDELHLNCTLSGYFTKVLSSLLQFKMNELIAFFYSCQIPLRKLFANINDIAISDFLIQFFLIEIDLIDESNENFSQLQIACLEELVMKMDTLSQQELENLGYLINEIIVKYYLIWDGKELLNLLTSEKAVQQFFRLTKTNKPNQVINRIAVQIITNISQYYSYSFNLFSADNPNQDNQCFQIMKQKYEELPFMLGLHQYIPIYQMLLQTNALQKLKSQKSTTLGSFRLQLIDFFCTILTMNHDTVLQLVSENRVIPVIFELFLAYPWHNVLHTIIERLFVRLFLRDSYYPLITQLFLDFKLIQRIIDITKDHAYQSVNDNQTNISQESEEQQIQRKNQQFSNMIIGSMGYILKMLKYFFECLSSRKYLEPLQVILDLNSNYSTFQSQFYEYQISRENTDLGNYLSSNQNGFYQNEDNKYQNSDFEFQCSENLIREDSQESKPNQGPEYQKIDEIIGEHQLTQERLQQVSLKLEQISEYINADHSSHQASNSPSKTTNDCIAVLPVSIEVDKINSQTEAGKKLFQEQKEEEQNFNNQVVQKNDIVERVFKTAEIFEKMEFAFQKFEQKIMSTQTTFGFVPDSQPTKSHSANESAPVQQYHSQKKNQSSEKEDSDSCCFFSPQVEKTSSFQQFKSPNEPEVIDDLSPCGNQEFVIPSNLCPEGLNNENWNYSPTTYESAFNPVQDMSMKITLEEVSTNPVQMVSDEVQNNRLPFSLEEQENVNIGTSNNDNESDDNKLELSPVDSKVFDFDCPVPYNNNDYKIFEAIEIEQLNQIESTNFESQNFQPNIKELLSNEKSASNETPNTNDKYDIKEYVGKSEKAFEQQCIQNSVEESRNFEGQSYLSQNFQNIYSPDQPKFSQGNKLPIENQTGNDFSYDFKSPLKHTLVSNENIYDFNQQIIANNDPTEEFQSTIALVTQQSDSQNLPQMENFSYQSPYSKLIVLPTTSATVEQDQKKEQQQLLHSLSSGSIKPQQKQQIISQIENINPISGYSTERTHAIQITATGHFPEKMKDYALEQTQNFATNYQRFLSPDKFGMVTPKTNETTGKIQLADSKIPNIRMTSTGSQYHNSQSNGNIHQHNNNAWLQAQRNVCSPGPERHLDDPIKKQSIIYNPPQEQPFQIPNNSSSEEQVISSDSRIGFRSNYQNTMKHSNIHQIGLNYSQEQISFDATVNTGLNPSLIVAQIHPNTTSSSTKRLYSSPSQEDFFMPLKYSKLVEQDFIDYNNNYQSFHGPSMTNRNSNYGTQNTNNVNDLGSKANIQALLQTEYSTLTGLSPLNYNNHGSNEQMPIPNNQTNSFFGLPQQNQPFSTANSQQPQISNIIDYDCSPNNPQRNSQFIGASQHQNRNLPSNQYNQDASNLQGNNHNQLQNQQVQQPNQYQMPHNNYSQFNQPNNVMVNNNQPPGVTNNNSNNNSKFGVSQINYQNSNHQNSGIAGTGSMHPYNQGQLKNQANKPLNINAVHPNPTNKQMSNNNNNNIIPVQPLVQPPLPQSQQQQPQQQVPQNQLNQNYFQKQQQQQSSTNNHQITTNQNPYPQQSNVVAVPIQQQQQQHQQQQLISMQQQQQQLIQTTGQPQAFQFQNNLHNTSKIPTHNPSNIQQGIPNYSQYPGVNHHYHQTQVFGNQNQLPPQQNLINQGAPNNMIPENSMPAPIHVPIQGYNNDSMMKMQNQRQTVDHDQTRNKHTHFDLFREENVQQMLVQNQPKLQPQIPATNFNGPNGSDQNQIIAINPIQSNNNLSNTKQLQQQRDCLSPQHSQFSFESFKSTIKQNN